MNLRRKYINQAITQPRSGFLKQGSESAISPPTSFLIQLVSICPGSQSAASQRGGQAAATPLPTATSEQAVESRRTDSEFRLVKVSIPCLRSGEWEELRTATAYNLFDSLLQPKCRFGRVPATPLPPWAEAMPAPHTCWRLPHILRESPEGDLQVLCSLQRAQATNQPGKLDL